ALSSVSADAADHHRLRLRRWIFWTGLRRERWMAPATLWGCGRGPGPAAYAAFRCPRRCRKFDGCVLCAVVSAAFGGGAARRRVQLRRADFRRRARAARL